MRIATVAVLLAATLVAGKSAPRTRRSVYGFYRSAGGGGWRGAGAGAGAASGRRVFGGAAAQLGVFPAACALLDRYWAARCSGAVLARRWALTAAHCVSPHVAYVKYNARRPAATDGNVATVHYLYRHPKYRVVQQDEGHGMDVTLLHHDVGLVRTHEEMVLVTAPQPHAQPDPRSDPRADPRPDLVADPLSAMQIYDPLLLTNEEITVLGFGRTERSALGEELFSARLRLAGCERASWLHCACGVAPGGVCAGDSGGPVLYRGVQVGVTSMGPMECRGGEEAAAGAARAEWGATSVFTALRPYAAVINATLTGADEALRMSRVGAARCARPLAPLALLAVAALVSKPTR